MTLVIGILVGAAVLAWVAWPLLRRDRALPAATMNGHADELTQRKLMLFHELEEIDLERERGDLSEEEYQELRDAQKQRVLALMHSSSQRTEIDDAIEQEILRVRASRASARASERATSEPALPKAAGGRNRWLWIGVPTLVLVLVFAGMLQLYQASSRTLTQQAPIAQLGVPTVRALAHAGPDRLVAATGAGLMYSEDGGFTWQQGALEGEVQTLAAVAGQPGRLYAVVENTLHSSQDGGTTWQAAPGTLPEDGVTALAADSFAPQTVYLGTAGGGIFRSVNAGATWSAISVPATPGAVRALLVVGNPAVLYAAFDNAVQVSPDDGATWTAASGAVNMSLGGQVAAMTASTSGATMYAAAHTGLFMTTTGGQTWLDLPLRQPLTAAVADPADARTLVVVTESGAVYRSEDGGISWPGK